MKDKEYKLTISTEDEYINFMMICGNDIDGWETKNWNRFTKEERDKFVEIANKFIEFANKFNIDN